MTGEMNKGRTGMTLKMERGEWAKIMLVGTIVFSSFVYIGKTVLDDAIYAIRTTPEQDNRIENVESRVDSLEGSLSTMNSTLVRLTVVLENLEAKIGDMDDESR